MFALTSRQAASSDAHSRGGWAFVPGGFVLPRWLRKPARSFARVWSGEVSAPPFAMAALSVAFLGSFSLYGVVIGGHMPSVVQAVTARTGFAIEEIRVSGNGETSEIDIFDRVGLDGWTSLVGFNPEEARDRIASLPWVETVSVRKIYPATLEVKIVEKVPFAIWQQGSRLSLIEASGEVIAPLSGSRYLTLPLVVGVGASEPASAFVAKIAGYPELASRVRGFVRVSERRWDIRLENGITVKLPERGEDQAISELLALDKSHGLLSRDVETVDLRFGDRLIVKLSSDAATAREATLKERLGKSYTPAGQSI